MVKIGQASPFGLVLMGMATGTVMQSAGPSYAADDANLRGKRVAILATDGFEQPELLEPRKALDAAGAKTVVVSPHAGEIKAWNGAIMNWGTQVPVDETLEEAKPEQFDALFLPGGVINPDKLRMDAKAVAFVKGFFAEGKPVAAICHGPQLLIEADAVRGHTLTSWPSLTTDLRNAGATWLNQPVVVDGTLVTSRKPDDIAVFDPQMIRVFAASKVARSLGH